MDEPQLRTNKHIWQLSKRNPTLEIPTYNSIAFFTIRFDIIFLSESGLFILFRHNMSQNKNAEEWLIAKPVWGDWCIEMRQAFYHK